MASNSRKKLLGVSIRGLAMGAADVIPGVSGGTIAFITGIYEELLETIANLRFGLLRTWKNEGFKVMWKQGNFSFLLALFFGIAVSVTSLAVFIEFLLENYPIQLWSFFFGLILASVWLVGRTVNKWNISTVIAVLIGTSIAYYVTIMSPVEGSGQLSLGYIFLCGSIAICAMILPGISGSFILLLLGAYTSILGAVTGILSGLKVKDWGIVGENGLIIVVFLLGCLGGLIVFSKLLNLLFKKAKNITIALLTGFLIGSLNKIWPWKETVKTFVKHKGEPNEEVVPLVQNNVSPMKFEEITGLETHFVDAIILMIFGVGIILLIDYLGRKNKA